jgi:serine/threonine-protein phosphatase 2A regulatory subunit B
MHPSSDSLFAYGMSKGTLRLGDLRVSSDVQASGLSFGEGNQHKNYIYELLANHCSLSFTRGGRQLVTRDCLTVKLWDINNTKKPLHTVMLNDGIKSKLCEMVENETIFDKFSLCASPDGRSIVSGSYNNSFHIMDPEDNTNCQY